MNLGVRWSRLCFVILYADNISYAEGWQVNVTLNIRPSIGTGVMFALVSGNTVPFALSLVDSTAEAFQVTTLNL